MVCEWHNIWGPSDSNRCPDVKDFPSNEKARDPGKVGLAISPLLKVGLVISPLLKVGLAISPLLKVGLAISPLLKVGLAISPLLKVGLVISPLLKVGLAISPLLKANSVNIFWRGYSVSTLVHGVWMAQ